MHLGRFQGHKLDSACTIFRREQASAQNGMDAYSRERNCSRTLVERRRLTTVKPRRSWPEPVRGLRPRGLLHWTAIQSCGNTEAGNGGIREGG